VGVKATATSSNTNSMALAVELKTTNQYITYGLCDAIKLHKICNAARSRYILSKGW
jgi:hypothetical protein